MAASDRDGLKLTLSLGGFEQEEPSSTMNTPRPHMQNQIHHQRIHAPPNLQLFYSSGVNGPPAMVVDREDEAGASSPNSTVSSISGKKNGRGFQDAAGYENETEKPSCSQGSDEEDCDYSDASRKKLRLSKEQSLILEETFKEHSTLNPKQKLALAKELKLRPRQVEVWFQNRRARTKLKQTEVDCEYLKRCCENLTEENRRLRKEVAELRALKLSPHMYMQLTPPTTLTMCPSCERVTGGASASNASLPGRQLVSPVPQRPLPWAAVPVQHRPGSAGLGSRIKEK